MRKLHVAAAQIHSGGSRQDVLARVERQVVQATAAGAQVILFAECALHGYDYDLTTDSVAAIAEDLHGNYCNCVVDIARRHNINILIGFFEQCNGAYHNSHLVARPDGTRDVERKHALTGGELKAGLTPGIAERKTFVFNNVRTSIIICADTGIEKLHDGLVKQQVDYRFIPTGGGGKVADMLREGDLGTPEGRKAYEENRPRVFKTEAILPDDQCPGIGFTAANALGPAGRQTCHQGHCMIVDNNCVMRAQIPGTNVLEHQQDQMIHAELNFPTRT